jgi:hypothetical protein
MAAKKKEKLPPEIAALRGLPVDQRAEALIAMFKFCTSEFAVMVLEYVKPPPKAKRKRRAY